MYKRNGKKSIEALKDTITRLDREKARHHEATLHQLAQKTGLLVFILNEDLYAVKINSVQEVVRYKPATRVPNAPLFIHGIMNLRGYLLPVINLRERFGLEPMENTDNARILVLMAHGQLAGVVVDETREIIQIRLEEISASLNQQSPTIADVIQGSVHLDAAKRINILSPEALLSLDEETIA